MTKPRLAIIFGGISPEHEVSIITGIQAMKAAEPNFEVIPLYVTQSGTVLSSPKLKDLDSYHNLPLLEKLAEKIILPSTRSHTPELKTQSGGLLKSLGSKPFDYLLPCFHGGVGEGGWIQGIAEYYAIPLLGSGLTGSAIGMDKVAMKAVFDGADIKQAPYIWFYRSDWYAKQATYTEEIIKHLKYPIFVKPSRGGSSIGTSCTKNKIELIRAIDLAASLDTRVVVEEGITAAREINISVMGNAGHKLEYSVCEEVLHDSSGFMDFDNKYLKGDKVKGMASASRLIPARLSTKQVQSIQQISSVVFNTLDLSGLVRIDYLIKGSDIYCVEVNTIPGSLSFYLWDKSGYSFDQLIVKLAQLANEKRQDAQSTITSFNSSILDQVQGGKLGSKLSS